MKLFAHLVFSCFPNNVFFFLASPFPVNFDIEVIKPGCGGVPTFTYTSKLLFTLLLMAFAGILFAFACLLRLCIRARLVTRTVVPTNINEEMDHELDDLGGDDTAEQVEGQPAAKKPSRRPSSMWKGLSPHHHRLMGRVAQLSMVWLEFKLRLCHAVLILLSIFYLRLTTLLFQGLVCDQMPNPMAPTDSEAIVTTSLYLREDGQTACWTGAHTGTATLVIFLLVFYSAGFPLCCFVLLMQAFTDESSTGVIGWLRKRFACLRGPPKRRLVPAPAADVDDSARPATPSRGGWVQEPAKTLSASEIQQAAKLQRRLESVSQILCTFSQHFLS